MSELKQERLSALIDDALGPDERRAALEDLHQDPELRACWNHYHLIGDALRGESLNPAVETVADRVRERLSQEAEILALPRRPGTRWLGPAAGAALAASVALLAIFTGPSLFQDTYPLGTRMVQYSPNPTLYQDQTGTVYWSLKGTTTGFASQPLEAPVVRAPDVQYPDMGSHVESKLNRFLVNHQEYAPASSMKGMFPYATLVSHGPRR